MRHFFVGLSYLLELESAYFPVNIVVGLASVHLLCYVSVHMYVCYVQEIGRAHV